MEYKHDAFPVAMLKGALIGASGMVPGASGGILAVAFGVYHDALDAVANIFTHFKRSFVFLLPYGIGGVIGLFITALMLEWLLKNWRAPLMYLLIGMVLGGVPSLLTEANRKNGFKKKYLLCVLIGAAVVTAIALADSAMTGMHEWDYTPLTAALAGGIVIIGVVIPGVSTSFILMYMGLYEPLLSSVTSLDIPMLICAGIGALLVGGMLLLFVKRMLDRHPGGAYYCILGFLLGTVVLIFPGVFPLGQQLFYVLLAAAGFASTLIMEKIGKYPEV